MFTLNACLIVKLRCIIVGYDGYKGLDHDFTMFVEL